MLDEIFDIDLRTFRTNYEAQHDCKLSEQQFYKIFNEERKVTPFRIQILALDLTSTLILKKSNHTCKPDPEKKNNERNNYKK